MTRPVNTGHPRYTMGVLAANRALDATGGISAQETLDQWEQACRRAHKQEDVDAWHYARGQADTLRAFVKST